jgi:hypothetical protein
LCHDFTRIKLDQHSCIRFEVLHRDSEAEVIEYEELDFEVVQFGKGKATDLGAVSEYLSMGGCWEVSRPTYLGISIVGVKNVRKELASAGHPRNNESMDVETVDDEIRCGANRNSIVGYSRNLSRLIASACCCWGIDHFVIFVIVIVRQIRVAFI